MFRIFWFNFLVYICSSYFYSHVLFYIHSNTLIFQTFVIFCIVFCLQSDYKGHIVIVNIMLSELASAFSVPSTDKAQCVVFLIFNSSLQLIYGILSDRQNLLEFFNSTTIIVFFEIPLTAFWCQMSNCVS